MKSLQRDGKQVDDVSGQAKKKAVAAMPRRERAAATRRALVLAALQAFSTKSFDAVAIDDIADTAGVAHGLAFHYFGSKRGLYLEALREVGRQLGEVHAVEVDGSAAARIRAMLTRHMRYMSRHRELALHLFRGGLGTDPEAWRIVDASRAAATAWMAAELGLDPTHPALRLTLRAFSGAIDEATVHWLAHRRSASLDLLIDALLEMLRAALVAATLIDGTLDVTPALRALGRTPPRSRR